MRQRVVIARALTVDPEMLVADEAVSMIDVSLRLGILALLKDLRERLGVSVLFITHDVATARYIGADGELYVIYRGQVVERGPVDTIIADPRAPVHAVAAVGHPGAARAGAAGRAARGAAGVAGREPGGRGLPVRPPLPVPG
ncbi:hypothetical protein GCM10020220_060350 [Nonomuraea rubra]|uniref:ABC transporter ATP-binding protein n=1 Tax=Nonomuraea rubra TaxID=46180 RepID=UPI0031EE7647